MEQAVQQQVLKATEVIEQQLDAEIERLDHMDADEMEILRQKRLAALKKGQEQKREWLDKGHGIYTEIPGEKEFFQECKKSKKVVCHFYRESTFRCKIVDKHMNILANKHIETRFLKIDAEKSPFLTDRLKIKVLPTLALILDGKTKDYIVGFEDLGGTDDFPTEMLEWRLGCAGIIDYNGNLSEPPVSGKPKANLLGPKSKKIIRGRDYDEDSDSDMD